MSRTSLEDWQGENTCCLSDIRFKPLCVRFKNQIFVKWKCQNMLRWLLHGSDMNTLNKGLKTIRRLHRCYMGLFHLKDTKIT